MRIVVYADGGCSPNPGPGGWGVVISGPDGPVDLCGGEPNSTNNRMELTAAIRALEHFPEGAQIEMRCDSQYVVKSVTEWMRGWKAKGWRNSKGPVMNLDLMQRLDELAGQRDVKWTWVQGHAGDPLNERADRLVTQGRHEARRTSDQPSSSPRPAAKGPVGNLPPPMSRQAMAAFRQMSFLADKPLAREILRAVKQSGTGEAVFLEDCIRFVLALGPEETARLRASMRAKSDSAA
ncbi:ribonuclease HI [Methylobacterium longum]|uniref:Ribonuclease H n=1 Tax=Methylobacterium longum TaxID=767694 RepID=A0ABT8AKH9_9HYPH|nr:ribonuclease HI [Methylobacterium longum]MDN3570001.1 ribonuclease HI [Methylobacterium longum]GJE12786.1 Ribonuclease H [Methylobacterium longum]